MTLVPRREADTGEPRFSVAVPVLNGGPRLITLLGAVCLPGVEILLADSGSTDGAVDEALARFPSARVWDVPPGAFDHGRTRTALVEQARAPLVALFSQDAVPLGSAYLAALAAPFSNPRVVGAMARQVPRPGADPLTAATLRRWTPPGDEVQLRSLGERGWRSLGPLEQLELARFDNVASMVRRDAVVKLPFPPRAFGEDLAWGAAAVQAGHTLAYAPGALVEHHHDPGLASLFRRHRVAHQQARAEFGLVALPSLLGVAGAWGANLAQDRQEVGLVRALAAGPRRLAELLGQWAGGR